MTPMLPPAWIVASMLYPRVGLSLSKKGIIRIKGPPKTTASFQCFTPCMKGHGQAGLHLSYLLQGQAPRFPQNWLKIYSSPGYLGWTVCGRVHQKSNYGLPPNLILLSNGWVTSCGVWKEIPRYLILESAFIQYFNIFWTVYLGQDGYIKSSTTLLQTLAKTDMIL